MKEYLNSREDKQTSFKYKKYNSFVSPGAKFEFEIDIMDVLARDSNSSDVPRYGLCAIDNFTKVAEVIPIKNRQPSEIIRGLKLIKSMGKPKQIYSDEEGGLRSLQFNRFMNENDMKSIQTNTHAHTVERLIKPF